MTPSITTSGVAAAGSQTATGSTNISQIGYIVRPHRRSLSDKNCEILFFLKNNAHLFHD